MSPSSEQEQYSDHLNLNVNKSFFELYLNDNTQRHWRPIDGVGEIDNELFVGNYMIDSNKSVEHFS